MHSVGDMADGNFLFLLTRVEFLPHFPADLPVELAHTVGVAAAFQGQHRHAEELILILGMHLAHLHDF